MIAMIRKHIFSGSSKNQAAPHILLVLCAYAVITTLYTLIFFDVPAMAVRAGLCVLLIAIFVAVERSRLDGEAKSFLSPTLMAMTLVFGALYFKGDGLIFIYLICIAFISLTYFSKKGLAAHILTVGPTVAALLFVSGTNLLGASFTLTYNIISYIAAMGLNALAYSLCLFCVKMIKNSRAAAEKLNAVISNYSGVIWSVDREETITLFNGLYLKEIGVTCSFLEGKKLDVARQKNRHLDIIENVKKTFTEGPQEWVSEIDGKRFRLQTTPIYDEEGKMSGVVGSAYDVTEMMELQEKYESAMNEAKEANIAKSAFLSNMSHEIRAPMNAIIGMTQIAAKTDEVARLKYCLSNIESSSEHLLGLINDILDMSKIEAGKLELDVAPINIEKMLIKVCNFVTEKIEQKNIRFNIILARGMRMHYIGDELRLSQVITNLFSNAVKFTPVDGEIELTAKEEHSEEDFSILRFAVRDTGIGITDEQMGRLFSAFEQAEKNTSRKFGGTGLGLAISKNIVEKMGGRIWVDSKPREGSTFTFEVRLQRPQKQDGPVIFGNIKPSDIKLLILDAKSDERDYFKSIVESFGIEHIDEADSVAMAVDLAETARLGLKPYDIVFVDYTFTDAKNIEYMKNTSFTIKKNNIVVISTFLNWNKIEEALHGIGIKRFVTKPLFPSSVLDTINEIISQTTKNLDITSKNANEMPDFSEFCLLIAEDVEINREIAIALLEDTHVRIECVENGLEAVEAVQKEPKKYALILMDMQMPVMDGLEATRRIRALDIPEAARMPIVAMTANAFAEDVAECKRAGMNDHIGKPLDAEVFINKLAMYLK